MKGKYEIPGGLIRVPLRPFRASQIVLDDVTVKTGVVVAQLPIIFIAK